MYDSLSMFLCAQFYGRANLGKMKTSASNKLENLGEKTFKN